MILNHSGGVNVAEQYPTRSAETSGGEPQRRRGRSILGRIFSIIGTLLLIIILTGSFLACFAATYIQKVILPNTELDIADYPMNLSSTIYYTNPDTGAVSEYEKLHGDQNRIWVKYADMPKNLIHATVALEDRRFYKHHGVDWLSTAKGVVTMFTGGNIRGGSTITQQLIKNLTTYDDVTVKRKILEIFRALEFDKKYDKTQTLEWYLNYVYFGRRCYGVYTASYMYFGKSVMELDLAECASLISITNNPSLYDPYTHPENNHNRRNQALDWMYTEGYISERERDAAKAEEIDFHSSDGDDKNGTAYSWYTEQVITDVINDLIQQYHYSETAAHDMVYSGGLKIYACVDTRLQDIVDNIYSNRENLPYTSASGQQLQSAIVVVDPQGKIVALSGKIGEKTSKDTRGWNRATRTTRQPGSTIKPLAVYAPALEMGLITPYSVLEDSPSMLVNEQAWPSNVTKRYLGQMTVNYALANSTNTIAVRVLEMVTPEVGFEYLTEKFGVDPDHLVVSRTVNGKKFSDIGYSQLALGGLTDGVSTRDMAGAYSVFPRDGVYIQPRTYSRVEDSNHKVLLQTDAVGEVVLKEKTTYYMNEMLQNVVTEGGGTEASLEGMTVAGKTGSTTYNNDRWFVGYTPYYTAAVWVGYDIPERVKVSGNPAAKMWNKVMRQIHDGLPDRDFTRASGLVEIEYCLDSGQLATDKCERDVRGSRVETGYFYPEDVPTEECSVHTSITVCTADPVLNSQGKATGRYRLAGSHCPSARESENGKGRRSVTVLDLEREYIGGVVPEDNAYLRSSYSKSGYCTVHKQQVVHKEPDPYDPSTFNILDPATWPSKEQDPHFNSEDPTTWPVVPPDTSALPSTSAVPSESPVSTEGIPTPTVTESPAILPPPEVTSTPTEEPIPVQTVLPPPDEEAVVPVGGGEEQQTVADTVPSVAADAVPSPPEA